MSINLKNLKNKNIHIVGIAGAEGSAVAEFLVANNISSITGHDFSLRKDFKKAFYNTHLSLKPDEREKALEHLLNLAGIVEMRHCLVSTATAPIKINFKDHYLEGIEEADIIFVSQVWFKYPQNLPILQNIKNSGVSFKTITNLYFELAPCKIISITGTNGKTTTARLINNIFKIWAENYFIIPTRAKRGTSERNGGTSLFQKNLYCKQSNNTKEKILENEGVKPKIYFAGNDRQNIQVLDKLNEMTKDDVLILETSSTQLLLNSKISPQIGVITNITPNHLDDHGSFENYIEAKKNLIRYQKAGDWAVLNYDDKESKKFIKSVKSKVFLFSRRKELGEGCFVKDGNIIIKTFSLFVIPTEMSEVRTNGVEEFLKCSIKNKLFHRDNKIEEIVLFSTSDIKIPGKHNLENVLAAVSAAYLYGVEPEIIKKGILEYTGTKHRLKLLYNINGIKYYDDTQATTPEATVAGIESFSGDIILLAGGDNKGMNYEKLAEKINKKTKLLILFPGDASDKIEKLINKKKINFVKVNDLSEAAEFLKKYYKKISHLVSPQRGGTIVLISPAAAHFYSRYVESSGKSLRKWIKLAASIK